MEHQRRKRTVYCSDVEYQAMLIVRDFLGVYQKALTSRNRAKKDLETCRKNLKELKAKLPARKVEAYENELDRLLANQAKGAKEFAKFGKVKLSIHGLFVEARKRAQTTPPIFNAQNAQKP